MTQHTPEPWWAGRDPCHFHSLSSITGGSSDNGGVRSVAEVTGPTLDEQQANTLRIVSCVNALANLNPEHLSAVLEAAKNVDGEEIQFEGSTHIAIVPERVQALRDALSALEGAKQ